MKKVNGGAQIGFIKNVTTMIMATMFARKELVVAVLSEQVEVVEHLVNHMGVEICLESIMANFRVSVSIKISCGLSII